MTINRPTYNTELEKLMKFILHNRGWGAFYDSNEDEVLARLYYYASQPRHKLYVVKNQLGDILAVGCGKLLPDGKTFYVDNVVARSRSDLRHLFDNMQADHPGLECITYYRHRNTEQLRSCFQLNKFKRRF